VSALDEMKNASSRIAHAAPPMPSTTVPTTTAASAPSIESARARNAAAEMAAAMTSARIMEACERAGARRPAPRLYDASCRGAMPWLDAPTHGRRGGPPSPARAAPARSLVPPPSRRLEPCERAQVAQHPTQQQHEHGHGRRCARDVEPRDRDAGDLEQHGPPQQRDGVQQDQDHADLGRPELAVAEAELA